MIRVRVVQLRRRIGETARRARVAVVAGYDLIGWTLLASGVWVGWGEAYGLIVGGLGFLVMAFEPKEPRR